MLDSWEGRRRLQEEYAEWRVVRDGRGIRRVELTTELGDYWRLLAACNPRRTLDLVATFARQDEVPVDAVYRGCDPFARGTTDEERETAFAAAMLAVDDPSPYNDGRLALTCMVQRTNSLGALVALAAAAGQAMVVVDAVTGRLRCVTCDEAIPGLGACAQAGRASDPLLVERLGRLAYEGRLVAFDEPTCVFIHSIAHGRLRLPNGDPVPPEWFHLSRGTAWGRQRLVLEPPSGTVVDDIVDVATEQRLRHGGQVAELVQVAVVLAVSGPGVVEVDPTEISAPGAPASDCHGCDEVRRFAAGLPA